MRARSLPPGRDEATTRDHRALNPRDFPRGYARGALRGSLAIEQSQGGFMQPPFRRAPGWLAALIAGAVLVLPAAASANPFPGNGDQTVADNSLHTYCYTTGFTTDQSVAAYAMSVLDSTTDMSDLFATPPATCAYMETDVWWWESDQPGGIRGVRGCWLESPNGICTSSDIHLDYAQLDIGSSDWEDRRKTAVHEVGHSIGLAHDSISAMVSGEIPSTSITWRRYSAHDISHLNAAY
jgi:hypothetical protein